MMRRLLLIAIPLVTLSLVACGQGARQPGSVKFESPPTDAPAAPARDSDILTFKAPKLGGGQVDGGDLEGKDVAIWFWAPW